MAEKYDQFKAMGVEIYSVSTDSPTSMNFMMEIPSLFANYATIVDNAKKVGATVQFSLKEAITGVSLAALPYPGGAGEEPAS